jgi:hypothetical protein
MIVCYLRNDSETDVERCRMSLGARQPITLLALDSVGVVSGFTGVVVSIQFDPGREIGMRWRVEMDISTVASPDPAKPASRTNGGEAFGGGPAGGMSPGGSLGS